MRSHGIFLFIIVVMSSLNVRAADVSWNAASSNFAAAANWSSGAFPGTGDVAYVNNGGTAVLGATAPANTISSLRIGSSSTAVGTLNQTGQSLTVSGEIWIGNGGGKGTFNMSGGTLNAQSWLSVARHWPLTDPVGTTSTFNFSGGTVNKAGSSDVNIGERGTGNQGTLSMSGSAVFNVTAGNFVVGAGDSGLAGGLGVVNVGGNSTLNLATTGVLRIGSIGGGGIVTLNGGTVNLTSSGTTCTYLFVGVDSAGGTAGVGSLVVNSGSLSVRGWFCVGRTSGSGTVTMNGGTITKTAGEGDLIVGSGNPFNTSTAAGTGTWIQNGGSLHCETRIVLGQAGGAGTLRLNGGTLRVLAVGGGAGAGNAYFNGGVLQAAGTDVNILSGLNNAYVQSGGAVIDTQAYDVSISQAFRHDSTTATDGGLIKRGAGSLTLDGVVKYNGNTVVSAGTLIIAQGIGAAGTKLIDVQAGKAVLQSTNVKKTDLVVQTASNATFEIADGSHTLNSITGSGSTIIYGDSTLVVGTLVQDMLILGGSKTSSVLTAAAQNSISSPASVPEPNLLTLALGGVALGLLGKRFRRRSEV